MVYTDIAAGGMQALSLDAEGNAFLWYLDVQVRHAYATFGCVLDPDSRLRLLRLCCCVCLFVHS